MNSHDDPRRREIAPGIPRAGAGGGPPAGRPPQEVDPRHRELPGSPPPRGSNAPDRGRFSRSQRATVLSGIVSVVAVIAVLQLWLLTATMNAYLGGDRAVAAPAAAASLVCFVLVAGLLRYLYRLDR